MRLHLARNRVAIYVAAACLLALCAFIPTPYSLILPGRAVDLADVVSLGGGHPAQTRLYLTDVRFATRVTPLELLSAFLPGVRVVWTNDILPSGVSMTRYEGVEREAMSESQTIAAAVAERAAGYHVPSPRSRVMVVYFVPHSRASQVLRQLDILAAVDGKSISSSSDLQKALRRVKAGTVVHVGLFRNGGRRIAAVQTTAYRGRTVLGTYLTTIYERPRLPVGVSFHLPHVAGSSGGLMFALEIYRSLKRQPLPGELRIAGTGTIAYDGSVGPIEGAAQKVAAARAAGASLFLVPAENYAEVKGTGGIHVVPVASFNQAVHAVASAAIPQ
ncbi:MAG TPA: PDZ domain-containing protein [Candidatus Rubrimentiphilum sp.]|nr:PDZ domain-containing protein [Candidatus Rubrimentiphilum sp.]